MVFLRTIICKQLYTGSLQLIEKSSLCTDNDTDELLVIMAISFLLGNTGFDKLYVSPSILMLNNWSEKNFVVLIHSLLLQSFIVFLKYPVNVTMFNDVQMFSWIIIVVNWPCKS